MLLGLFDRHNIGNLQRSPLLVVTLNANGVLNLRDARGEAQEFALFLAHGLSKVGPLDSREHAIVFRANRPFLTMSFGDSGLSCKDVSVQGMPAGEIHPALFDRRGRVVVLLEG